MSICAWLKTKTLRFAVQLAMRRKSPRTISLSGEKALKNNCYSVRLADPDGTNRFNVQAVYPKGLEGWWFNDGHQGGLPASIHNDYLNNFLLRIDHYYRGYIIDTRSSSLFIIKWVVGYAFFAVGWDRIKQFFYNRRRLMRNDRMKILRLFVEKSVEKRDFDASAIGIMTELYGKRWAGHPQFEAVLSYYHLVLDSLAESEALRKAQYGYTIGPKALATLDRYEEDDRRHSDNRRVQRTIAWLTGLLALIAFMQVAATVWQEVHPDTEITVLRSRDG